jgi:UDP-N-acetylmuramoyl-L-alanyl-D-glutamate--2,6-diaminopimelate ligase
VSPVPNAAAHVAVERASFDAVRFGMSATVRVGAKLFELSSSLLGAHNLENTVVALGIIEALGLDVELAISGIGASAGVPGRLERADGPRDSVRVLVDYAHTPDALTRVLAAVRNVSEGRILCVFGCGGDRDPLKRGPMGQAVAEGADLALVTSDNPRSEDADTIAAPIVAALQAAELSYVTPEQLAHARKGYVVEQDRARAIHLAIDSAHAGDVVVIAGKGHETYQIVGDVTRDFDDRLVAKHALELRRERQVPSRS